MAKAPKTDLKSTADHILYAESLWNRILGAETAEESDAAMADLDAWAADAAAEKMAALEHVEKKAANEAAFYKKEAKVYTSMAAERERLAERMKASKVALLRAAGTNKLQLTDGRWASFRDYGKVGVVLENIELLEDRWFRRTEREVMKTELQEAIEGGDFVPGAKVEHKPAIRVQITKGEPKSPAPIPETDDIGSDDADE